MRLPSGAELELKSAPFANAKELYQAFLDESKSVKIDSSTELDLNLYKDLFCAGLSSKRIDDALAACMARCLYNGIRITDATFEPETAREDYFTVCFEVAKHNLYPFLKNLSVAWSQALAQIKNFQK